MLLDKRFFVVIICAAMFLFSARVFSQTDDAAQNDMEIENGADIETVIESDTAETIAPAVRPRIVPRETIFLGITDRAGQSVRPDFERAIRLELAANPLVALVGELETQRVVREIERLSRTRTELFIPPNFALADSAIVIRAMAGEPAVRLGRRMLIFGKADVTVNIRIIFSEFNGLASYDGEFSATATKKKGWLLFAKPNKAIHLSAPERSELIENAQREVLEQIAEFIKLFYNSLH